MTLPAGFTVRLDPDVDLRACPGLLVGGSPLTVCQLSDRARELVDDDTLTVTDEPTSQLAERLLRSNLAHPDTARLPEVEPTDLTVVIPTRDRVTQLDTVLTGLRGLTCVVVDDASTDPRAIAAVCARHEATLLRLDDNVGPAAARNHGRSHVTTALVAFVDSDVIPTSEALLALSRHFADPSVVLVGPCIVGRSTHGQPRWFERYDERSSSLTLGTRPGTVAPGTRVSWLPSACLVGRTDALGAGFDPELRVGEDVDLVWRLDAAGKTVRYDPSVVVEHETRPTLAAWLGRKALYGTGAAVLAARHGDAVAPAVLDPLLAAAGASVLLRTRWSIPLCTVAAMVTAARVGRSLPPGPGRRTLAGHLAALGLGWGVRQESSLLVRHWWPAAAAASAVSPRMRRAVISALAVDGALALARHGDDREPVTVLAGNLADGLAYGAGVWWGCWRQRSAAALLPRRPRRTR